MDKVTASEAKQKLGEYLERAASAPLAIERHGKVVAGLVPPEWLSRAELLDERRQARQAQQRIEQERLLAHHRIAMELLVDKRRRQELLDTARREVRRWSQQGLCSQDYIDRWSEWLSLPAAELAKQMCSDANGWGNAMRQNSPFGVAVDER
ncbi:type II toxin-antitoxin system Phd/YefM family antitoxin [Ramlibacter rhizophilus]|uniref:Antitoxin n=1 Tax=Ramlibacter rhizophilus TaxID=1781167 RepID=A0A4Z0BJV3_9BURK|nr:type II toxin-antitoxin system Phd/YefM family antitoxin [Ramlibacter rhizophilus]TFY98693.1 type II toxin-antitoxin system Phd/YefM family antitoxin [Ramlibacter rhizophilus]